LARKFISEMWHVISRASRTASETNKLHNLEFWNWNWNSKNENWQMELSNLGEKMDVNGFESFTSHVDVIFHLKLIRDGWRMYL
jgi:hypothetical protein